MLDCEETRSTKDVEKGNEKFVRKYVTIFTKSIQHHHEKQGIAHTHARRREERKNVEEVIRRSKQVEKKNQLALPPAPPAPPLPPDPKLPMRVPAPRHLLDHPW